MRRKPVFLKSVVDNLNELQPLPTPRGDWPYRYEIAEVGGVSGETGEFMEFHMVGDTGSLRNPQFQRQVAQSMAGQIPGGANGKEGPGILLHLGDVVYDHGEAREYAAPFFGPSEDYPVPVYALAGNHDGGIKDRKSTRLNYSH